MIHVRQTVLCGLLCIAIGGSASAQITKVLRHCRGNRSATARELGIGRRTLYAKMEKLGITASWGV